MLKVTKKQTESDSFLAESADEIKESRKSRFFHPYLQLFISVVLTAFSQILLKIGVDTQFVSPWYTTSNFFAFWIWLGILAIIGSLFSWLFALKSVPLIIAFNLAATNHIMVAIGSWLFLGVAALDRHFSGSARRFFCRQVGRARGGETVTLFFFCLVVFSVACSVTGQIFFKHAMSDQSTSTRTRRRLDLAGGVLAMTVGFFTWLEGV